MARPAGKTERVMPSARRCGGGSLEMLRIARVVQRLGRLIPEEELRRIPKAYLQPSRPLRIRNAKAVRRVFADTLYWLALFLPGDEWAEAARMADLSDASLVTTEEVLSEFLTAVSAHGDRARRLACRAVREIQPRGLHFHERHAATKNPGDPHARPAFLVGRVSSGFWIRQALSDIRSSTEPLRRSRLLDPLSLSLAQSQKGSASPIAGSPIGRARDRYDLHPVGRRPRQSSR